MKDALKEEIISQDNSPQEDELGETASIQSSPVKTVFESSEDTHSPKEQTKQISSSLETGLCGKSPLSHVNKTAPEDTLCSNCGKLKSEHLKEKGKLYCWSTDGNTEGEFIPIGDEGVKG